MVDNLDGKVAVITGAASGIGRAMVNSFASQGCSIVLADVETEALSRAVDEVTRAGASAIGVRTDVSNLESIQNLADRAVEAFGGVHVLANNAAVASGTTMLDIPDDVWNWVLDVDLWGVINGSRVFLPLLRQQEQGHIVNTASMSALNGFPLGQSPYVVAKFGVWGFSQNLFHETLIADEGRIGVSVLIPGFVRTKMLDSGRNRPEHVSVPTPSEFQLATRQIARQATEIHGLDPAIVGDLVVDAVRDQKFYILTHPEEAYDMWQQQYDWMRGGAPLQPGPGVARASDLAAPVTVGS